MKRDDSVYLQHVLDAIGKVELYLQGIDEPAFQQQSLIQDGAIRQLEVIGEAIKNLSSELRDRHPHVRWKAWAGMRDKLIHQYFGVDLQKVWDTATVELTGLKTEVIQILQELLNPTK